MTPEFSRPLALDRIRAGLTITVEADAAERAALAARLGVPHLAALTCRFRLRPVSMGPGVRTGAGPRAGVVMAEGALRARVTQVSVVSLDEFEADVAEDFLVCFVPEDRETADLDPESVDEMPYAGDAIDLGEAAAEQLALALDPYPRREGEE